MLVVTLLTSATLGLWVRRRFGERHLCRDSIDSIRLMMSMLLTFAALVLGLLTSNAKQRFDGLSDSLSAFGTDLIELDNRLREYGPVGDSIRIGLRAYTAAAIASSWPHETKPPGDYPDIPRNRPGVGIEDRKLGDLLADVDRHIEELAPLDPFHVQIASRLRDRVAMSIQQRWRLIFSARSTLSWPFLLTLTTWLAIVFAIFGMTSPPRPIVYVVVVLSALSIASPLYLIISYNQALSGEVTLPSDSMRAALAHMDAD